ncbi:hypothetical protein B0T18DRAFT_489562 [Schizothecium vesticola]|uniref:Uncharacterized protein n=1 Tax=Schizothecium vesticola TaxID=314040 RepID=A0AA40ENH6_9PEZI|nr:hypothetical protein B0T18DRAFT_489562 [Schizothecium vesticola]
MFGPRTRRVIREVFEDRFSVTDKQRVKMDEFRETRDVEDFDNREDETTEEEDYLYSDYSSGGPVMLRVLVRSRSSIWQWGRIWCAGRAYGDSRLPDRRSTFDSLAGNATGSPSTVNLDSLFADMDMCEFDACLDVTSLTAYYVDLLQYLRSNNLDRAPKMGQRRQGRLTCTNANTALPMIDLASEVMEAFVINSEQCAGTGRVTIETWNIGRETTGELLASPSHVRKRAYCILKEAKFPLATLPYFQPLEATRLAQQWMASSWIIATPEKEARYADLRGRVQDRAAAAEYLRLSPALYIAITRESFWSIECSEFADDGTIINADKYREDIGVVEPFVYWGYPTGDALLNMHKTRRLGLSFVRAQLLLRTGYTFAEVAELARTKYVNPMLPTGRDKVLLDGIQFSYRFLQLIVPLLGVSDAGERASLLSALLFSAQAWFGALIRVQTPPTGTAPVCPEVPVQEFTEREIRDWVAKWFDALGNLSSWRTARPSVVTDDNDGNGSRILGYLKQTGDLWDGEDLFGFVWMDSKVHYSGLGPICATFPTGNIFVVQT